MLEDFQKLIITYDPDFIVGYNMVNFDLKYIL
jgi:DNA polymerase elongation subunit (family B)